MPIISSIFQKAEEKETLSSSFYEASIILVPKPEQSDYRKKKKVQKSYNTSHQVSCKTLNKNRMCVCVCVCINHHDLLSLSQECKSGLTFKIISMQFTILKFYTKTIHLNRCSESI